MKGENLINIGYFADGPWSYKALDEMLKDKELKVKFICARYENPDKHLEKKAKDFNIKFITNPDINSKEFKSEIIQFNCNLFVSMSFNQIMKKDFFIIPKLGTINCHAGKLPFYRGRNILNWALINDENEFGITVHYIDEGIDTGDIICQKTFPIRDKDNYQTLLNKSYKECPKILIEAINLIKRNKSRRIEQNTIHEYGMYCSKRKDGDEILDWDQNSRDIFNFVRGISIPGPCATTFVENNICKIITAEMVPNAPNYKCIAGAIIHIDKNGFLVKTLDSYIKVTNWESKIKLKVGMRFSK